MTSFPSSPSAPPVNPGQIDFDPEPPSWPKVIGIISIVWGSLGVVCNGVGFVVVMLSDVIVGLMPPAQQDQMKQQLQTAASIPSIATQVISVLLAALLIVAGVSLVQRKASGRSLHLLYAGIGILVAFGAGLATYMATQAQLQNLASDPNAAQMAGMMKASLFVGTAMEIIVRLVYPVFLLVWFGAIKKNAQLISQGMQNDHI